MLKRHGFYVMGYGIGISIYLYVEMSCKLRPENPRKHLSKTKKSKWNKRQTYLFLGFPTVGKPLFWESHNIPAWFSPMSRGYMPFRLGPYFNSTSFNLSLLNLTQLIFGPSATPILGPFERPIRPTIGPSFLWTHACFLQKFDFPEVLRFPM